MKTVVDLVNEPFGLVEVLDDTPVITTNGIHYLLTPEEEEELNSRVPDIEAMTLKDVYRKRTASLSDGGYGTTGEQFDMIYHDGLDTWKVHIEAIKENLPKP